MDAKDKEANAKIGERIMICPRCDSKNANLLIQSPVGNEWEMYICKECNFTWRSTESENIRNPKMYDPKFKLTKKKIAMMTANPPIAASISL
jgi:transposase-like protein